MNDSARNGSVLSLELRRDGVAVVVIDDRDASVNTLKAEMAEKPEARRVHALCGQRPGRGVREPAGGRLLSLARSRWS